MEMLQREKMLRQKLNPCKTAFLGHLAAVIQPMDDRTYRNLDYKLRHTLEAFEQEYTFDPSLEEQHIFIVEETLNSSNGDSRISKDVSYSYLLILSMSKIIW